MTLEQRHGGAAVGLMALFWAGAAIAATTADPRSGPMAALAAHHWNLIGWTAHQVPQGKRLRLDFDANQGRFSTDTMCNRVGGTYRVKGKAMRLGNANGGFTSTMMACPEPAMSFERAYTASLSAIRSWTLSGDRLVLRAARGETLTYQAAHKPAADAPRKLIYVAAETRPCSGVAPMTCLQVREKESDPWQLHYGGIVDFVPQPGIEYRLRIIEEKVTHPPADGSSVRWTLDEVIEQRVVHR